MPALKSLPPQFLLPAWSLGQLHQLKNLQLRCLHARSDQDKRTQPREQTQSLRKSGDDRPVIKEKPIIRYAGRPLKNSATGFTSLRRQEPRVVLRKSTEQDVVQNTSLDPDKQFTTEKRNSTTDNRRSSGSVNRSESLKAEKVEPNSQNRFRKVSLLKMRPLLSGEASPESVARDGVDVPIYRIRRYASIHKYKQDQAGSQSQGSYAAIEELQDKGEPHRDEKFYPSPYQRSTEQTTVSGRFVVQAEQSKTPRNENMATTAPALPVPLKAPKEAAHKPVSMTATNETYSAAAPIRHVPLEASSKATQQPVKQNLSLFEELFPEEARKRPKTPELKPAKQADLHRLPPLDFDMLSEFFDDSHLQGQRKAGSTLRDDSSATFRQETAKILVLERASTSLSEADFRHVVPTRGEHIEGWRGPGDILKVIPARDMATLSPKCHYFLLFPNLAYAQAYQKHVFGLHQLAKTYNSSSPSWGLSIAIGRKDNLFSAIELPVLMQNYTLSPPSVRLSLRLLDAPSINTVRTVIDHLGYPQIVTPDDKAGRSVLFWVDGYQPSSLSVKTMLAKDGQDRGLQWGPLRGCGSIEAFAVKPGEEHDEETEAEAAGEPDNGQWDRWSKTEDLKPKRNWAQRWVISFEDEAEARRFVRVWHRMPYMYPLQTEKPSRGEENKLVHAEFLW